MRIFFAILILSLTLVGRPLEAGVIVEINNDAKGGVDHLATVSWTFAGTDETGLAGTLVTKLPNGDLIDTYCVDLFDTTYVGGGGSTWTAELLSIAAFAGNPAGNPSGGNGGSIGYLYNQFAASAQSRIEGAALQVAIWKVEYDGSANLSSGSFRMTDSADLLSDQHRVFSQASSYLSGFDGSQSNVDATLFRATSHPGGLYQDLVGPSGRSPALASYGVAAVPEPSSIVLMMTAFGPLLVVSTRRIFRHS